MKYNGNNLKEVLEAHKRWLNDGGPTWGIKQFISVDEQSIETEETSRADFSGCVIRCGDFEQADLRHANFDSATLYTPTFHLANLSWATFRYCTITTADFRGAMLWCTSFNGSSIKYADFTHSYLSGATFYNSLLTKAHFKNAATEGVLGLHHAVGVPFIPMACPDEGSFVGWKKGVLADGSDCIIKLRITENAKRSSAGGRKCRCSEAEVLDIQNLDGESLPSGCFAMSRATPAFIYKVGNTVTPKNGKFDDNRWCECACGIHFFINRQEAVDY